MLANQSTPIRIALPFSPNGGTVNVYLFRTPEPILIDAGFYSAVAWSVLNAALGEHGLAIADLARVIITHPHVDHYGCAARIAGESQAQIWMAEVGVDWLHHFPQRWQQRMDYYRTSFLPGLGLAPEFCQSSLDWMQQTLDAWQPIPAERIGRFADEGELVLGGLAWQVLHLRGHDSHLTCFYQAQTRQLLAADMLMIPTPTPVVEAPAVGEVRQPALPHMLLSMDRLAALDIETVYPGHGIPFTDHRTVIRSQQARIHERKEECWRHIVAGVDKVADLSAHMYGPRAQTVGLAGLWMVVGYLDLLQAEARVAVDTVDGVWRYRVI